MKRMSRQSLLSMDQEKGRGQGAEGESVLDHGIKFDMLLAKF